MCICMYAYIISFSKCRIGYQIPAFNAFDVASILERWFTISIRTLFQNKDFTGDGSGFRIAKI